MKKSGFVKIHLADDDEYGPAIWLTDEKEEAMDYGNIVISIPHNKLMKYKHKRLPTISRSLIKKYREAGFDTESMDKQSHMLILQNVPFDEFEKVDSKQTPLQKESLQESLLLESVRGEWWIDSSGSALFADGDIGDMNHSTYVIDMVSREICGEFNVDCDEEYCSLSDSVDDIFSEIQDDLSEEQIERWSEGEEYMVMAEYLGLEGKGLEDFNRKVQVALDHTDPRDYCMQYMGWVRVIDDNVQTWSISNSILKNISNGLWDAYESDLEEFSDVDEEFEGQPTFTIEVLSNKTMFDDVPWAAINSDRLERLIPYRRRY